MASITIRNLDDEVKTRLRVRAAENGLGGPSALVEAARHFADIIPARTSAVGRALETAAAQSEAEDRKTGFEASSAGFRIRPTRK